MERGTMDFDDFALESMQQLTASGVRFAIDDFEVEVHVSNILNMLGFPQ